MRWSGSQAERIRPSVDASLANASALADLPGREQHGRRQQRDRCEGPDRARAWTDFTAFGTDEGGGIGIATIGRYYDELARDAGRWRYRVRTVVMDGDPLPEGVASTPAR